MKKKVPAKRKVVKKKVVNKKRTVKKIIKETPKKRILKKTPKKKVIKKTFKSVVDKSGVFLLCLKCANDCKSSSSLETVLGFDCRNYVKVD